MPNDAANLDLAQCGALRFHPDGAAGGTSVLIETKSLPRSGLHYLKNSLERILADGFSFCEWYEEEGCCRRMPCAFVGAAMRQDRPHLRLTKSHDFELLDPDDPPAGPVTRLIMLRDPLYVLTSWWCLAQLEAEAAFLSENAIDMGRIRRRHEPELVRAAFDLAGPRFDIARAEAELDGCLTGWKAYILAFVRKWRRAARAAPVGQIIVRYGDLPRVACALAEPASRVDPAVASRLDAFRRETRFVPRSDPFGTPATRLSDFLRAQQDGFRRTAREIAAQDETGLLATEA
jgi:hypothetical protein